MDQSIIKNNKNFNFLKMDELKNECATQITKELVANGYQITRNGIIQSRSWTIDDVINIDKYFSKTFFNDFLYEHLYNQSKNGLGAILLIKKNKVLEEYFNINSFAIFNIDVMDLSATLENVPTYLIGEIKLYNNNLSTTLKAKYNINNENILKSYITYENNELKIHSISNINENIKETIKSNTNFWKISNDDFELFLTKNDAFFKPDLIECTETQLWINLQKAIENDLNYDGSKIIVSNNNVKGNKKSIEEQYKQSIIAIDSTDQIIGNVPIKNTSTRQSIPVLLLAANSTKENIWNKNMLFNSMDSKSNNKQTTEIILKNYLHIINLKYKINNINNTFSNIFKIIINDPDIEFKLLVDILESKEIQKITQANNINKNSNNISNGENNEQ